jgi:hypothetical protein
MRYIILMRYILRMRYITLTCCNTHLASHVRFFGHLSLQDIDYAQALEAVTLESSLYRPIAHV